MKKLTLLALLLSFLITSLWAQKEGPKMDFEKYDPPSTLKVPEHPKTNAKFPFIDVHSHHWRMESQDLDKLANEMKAMNMGAMVNLSGRNSAKLKAMMANIKKSGYEGQFVIFSNLNFASINDPDWTKETVKQLEFDYNNGAAGLKIFKSLGLTVKDSDGNRVRINDPRIDPVWAKCGELGIPVLIHSADPKSFWEPHDEKNERWLELKLRPRRKRGPDNPLPWEVILAEQHDVFKKHPNTTFINAHFGWHANNLEKLSEMMEEMPNMYVECGAIIAELGRQPRNAKAFLTKYQDRILFGKDAYNPEEYHTYFRVLETDDEYFPYYKRYHAFWRMYGLDLDDEVLKKMYYKNALKIIKRIDKSLFPSD
ncbi:MAG: amidohydrolase family protein [Bacteroidota bacterium]